MALDKYLAIFPRRGITLQLPSKAGSVQGGNNHMFHVHWELRNLCEKGVCVTPFRSRQRLGSCVESADLGHSGDHFFTYWSHPQYSVMSLVWTERPRRMSRNSKYVNAVPTVGDNETMVQDLSGTAASLPRHIAIPGLRENRRIGARPLRTVIVLGGGRRIAAYSNSGLFQPTDGNHPRHKEW